MNEQREIVKASWLQHVVHKKGGTLHRKKVSSIQSSLHIIKKKRCRIILSRTSVCCRKFCMKKGNGLFYVFTVVVYHFWNGTFRKNTYMNTGIFMSIFSCN